MPNCPTCLTQSCNPRVPGECTFYTGPNIPGPDIVTGESFNTVTNKLVEYIEENSGGGATLVYTVTANSSGPVAVVPGSSNTIFTNEGASLNVNYNLPSPTLGLVYTFVVQNISGITISATNSSTIRIGSNITVANGSIASADTGSSITLVAINTSEWVAISINGTWII